MSDGNRVGRMRRLFILGGASALLAALGAAPAFGAEGVRGETVLDRARPEYDALALRLGAFDLFPSVEVGERWDDNIYRIDDARADDGIPSIPSDWIIFAQPRVRALSRWSNHSLAFDVGARVDRFRTNDDENNTDRFATLTGRLDAGRDNEFYASAEMAGLREARGGFYSIAGGEPDTFEKRGASAGWRNGLNRVSLSLDGRYDDYKYDNPARRFRDRSDLEWRGQAGYSIPSGHEVFVRTTWFKRRYDTRRSGLDRDSDGWEFAVGVDIDLGGLLFGELFAGYRRQSYEDIGLRSVERPSFGAALDWNVTPMTTLSVMASRTIEETVLEASGVLVTRMGIDAIHELRRNVLLTAALDFTNNNFWVVAGESRNEGDIWGGAAGIRWLINRDVHLNFDYRYETRDSNIPSNDYGNHVASLAFTLQL